VAYLVAFCHLDTKVKEFRLDRVRSFEVIDRLS
jgi:predicted DNA-binding transcriptional regulator YafY